MSLQPEKFDVFLSHAGADGPAVEELARRLWEGGISPWLDRWNLIPGKPWQEEIEQALDASEAYAIFIGPSGLGSWQHPEMRAAIDLRAKKGRRVIPVLLPGAERGQRSGLPLFLQQTTWVEFRNSLDDDNAFHRLKCGILGVEPGPAVSEPVVDRCPYPGLSTFQPDDAPFFFGREALTQWLIAKLRPSPGTRSENRFLAIIGSSGSGKSSLVRAGLIPALQRGELNGSTDWPIVLCRPGPDPVESLILALSSQRLLAEGNLDVPDAINRFTEEPRTLHRTTAEALSTAPEPQRIVIVVDQFEEVFTLCKTERTRSSFIRNLCYAGTIPLGKTIIVLTLRADFYGKCAVDPRLAAAVSENQILVGPMTADELKSAIVRPAQMVGCELQEGLVERLQHDFGDQAGMLPLLQHALRQLWERRRGRRLTVDAYNEIGQLSGALEKYANEVFASLSELEKQVCQRILLRLVQPGRDAQDTKRRVEREELGQSETTDNVIQKLTDAHLITTEGQGGKGFVELSHEALIRGWPRFREWIESNRKALRIRDRLAEDAALWREKGRLIRDLLHSGRLTDAEKYRNEHPEDLSPLEVEYLEASIAERERETTVQEEKHRHEEEQRQVERRKRRRQLTVFAFVSVCLAVAALGAVLLYDRAIQQTYWDRGIEERDRNNDPLKASHYFMRLANFKFANEAEKKKALLAAMFLVRNIRLVNLSEPQQQVGGIIFSADEKRVLTWNEDGSVRVWDSQTGEWNTLLKHEGQFRGATFSHDQKWILTWDEHDTARIWDVHSKKFVADIVPNGRVEDAVFSQDDSQILTWTDRGVAQVWNTHTGQERSPPLLVHGERPIKRAEFLDTQRILLRLEDRVGVWHIEKKQWVVTDKIDDQLWTHNLSEDKTRVLTVTKNGSVTVWHTETLARLSKPFGLVAEAAVFSPDGKSILTWGTQGGVDYWEYSAEKPIRRLLKQDSAINGAAFSRDGRRVMIWSDGTVRIWDDYDSGPRIIAQHKGKVLGASFDRYENRILVWDRDGTAQVWASRILQPLTPPLKHDDDIELAQFSSDQQLVTTWSRDGVAKLWSIQADGPVALPMVHSDGVKQAAFIRGTRQILTLTNRLKAQIWDTDVWRPREIDLGSLKGGPQISPDGQRILAWQDRSVRIWDLQRLGSPVPLEHPDSVQEANFSQDGNWVLTWSNNGVVRLWDSKNEHVPVELPPQDNVRRAIASKDRTRIFSWTYSGEAMLYTTGAEPIPLSPGRPIRDAIFNNDGGRILFWRSGGTLEDWDYRSGREPTTPLKGQWAIDGARLGAHDQIILTWMGNTAGVWDIKADKVIPMKSPHEDKILGGLFSLDSSWVLTWSKDRTARVWDAKYGRPLTPPLTHQGPVNGAMVSPDGRQVLTWSDDGTARSWNLSVNDSSPRKTLLVDHEIRTGSRLDDDSGELKLLSRQEWQERRRNIAR